MSALVQVDIRMLAEARDRLKVEAEARGVPMTWFAGRLITEGLERLIPADQFSLTRPDDDIAPGE